MDCDEAMLIPQNRNPSTGRAGTPSKAVVPTPQRNGSAPRTTSNGRSGSAKKLLSGVVVPTALNRGPSRSGAISTRKLRKWEMDQLFGVGAEPAKALFEDGDDDGIKNFGLSIDWRCLFSELFRSQNETARFSFLSCEDSVYQAPKFASRFSRLSTEVKAGELAWLRVPNKLRPVLQRAVEEDGDRLNNELGPIEYIRALESVIFYYLDTGYPAPVATLPAALTERLAEPLSLKEAPISVKDKGRSEDEEDWVHVNKDGDAAPPSSPQMGLEIVLEDSPLHRLLLHAIVQYHGLQTRSYDSKGHRCDNGVPQLQSQKKRDGRNANKASPVTQSNDTLRKAILVYRGQRSLQNEVPSTQQDRLSLVSFLQYKQKQRDDSKMQHLMRQIGLTASSC